MFLNGTVHLDSMPGVWHENRYEVVWKLLEMHNKEAFGEVLTE